MASERDRIPWTRRGVLTLLAGSCLGVRGVMAGDDPDEDREVDEVRKIAQDAGLPPLTVHRMQEYRAIGDASRAFQKRAMELCIGLEMDYSREFKDKGLPVEKRDGLMTLVVLSSRDAFNRYLGVDLGPDVAGIYEPDTNRLVLFDNRDGGVSPNAGRTNTMVLFHEATHQLTFSTGLLNPKGDVPLAIAEGFATYGEVRTIDRRFKVGDVNRPRLAGLFLQPGQQELTLNPVARLIAEDRLLEDDGTKQHAYSEIWVLVHYLMKTPARAVQFRKYLDAIRDRRDSSHRLEDWTAAFGPTEKIDQEVAAHATGLARGLRMI